jgi:hypothetical protein
VLSPQVACATSPSPAGSASAQSTKSDGRIARKPSAGAGALGDALVLDDGREDEELDDELLEEDVPAAAGAGSSSPPRVKKRMAAIATAATTAAAMPMIRPRLPLP